MREQVKGRGGAPVGSQWVVKGGVGLRPGSKTGILAGVESGRGLDIPGKHNKAAAFYIEKKRRWPLSAPPPPLPSSDASLVVVGFFLYCFFFAQCHVLPGPAGSQRPSLALTFGTSEMQAKGGGGGSEGGARF